MIGSRGPTIVTVPVHGTSKRSGIKCCCCQCCTCINLQFLKTGPGIVKALEVGLGFLCQSLSVRYGYEYSGTIGLSLQSFLAVASWCFMTTLLLLMCYVFSSRSIHLIKSSLFEIVFNTIAAFSYLTSGSYLGYIVNLVLEPIYAITPHYGVYPAMSASYMIGSVLGIIYAYDAYNSYKYFKAFSPIRN
ncbi:protein singles bar [Cylas formicarius]|uniref:protein singles bar n=1 Tax=Cylas formicarius TaxID=197179 RepID=UPI002958D0D4|nr:protein singles bar [Cylas formicarius]